MKFSGKVGNGPMNKWLNFGGDPENGSGIATLVRRALVEVCTVPVLLVQQSIMVASKQQERTTRKKEQLECGPMPNVMAALGI